MDFMNNAFVIFTASLPTLVHGEIWVELARFQLLMVYYSWSDDH